jgi:hypothetical protein
MEERFQIGQRVKVKTGCSFKSGTIGTIARPPEALIKVVDYGESHFRKGPNFERRDYFVWIVFDEPQLDGDGDGPYPEAEIQSRCLERI